MGLLMRVWQRLPRLRSSRWPTTAEEWWERASAAGDQIREACIVEAIRLNDQGLLAELHETSPSAFPVQEFVNRLNTLDPGAGNRAYRAAFRS